MCRRAGGAVVATPWMAMLFDSVAPPVKTISRGCAPMSDGDIASRGLDRVSRAPAPGMRGGGRVAEVAREIRQHRLEHTLVHRRRGVVIEVDGRPRHPSIMTSKRCHACKGRPPRPALPPLPRSTHDSRFDNPLWYRDAVIYQVHVRGFFDSNDDGIGDFRGLTQKLDYIQSLGVTAIWLQPFYPSPLRDDGYDIADYHGVHPSYGTRRDFLAFLNAAHDRGLRVITELVINHTSDQHPWFQAARRAPTGLVEARLLRLERHRSEVRGRADRLQGHRAIELDVGSGCRASTSGTASSTISRT